MRKKIGFLLTFILIVASFLAYLIFSTFTPPAPSVTMVHLNFYDYLTGKTVKGLAVKLNIATRMQNILTISGVSDGNGSIVQAISLSDIAFPVLAANISFSGRWVLEEVTGEKSWSVADQKWFATNPQAFISNSSEYVFDRVPLFVERNASTINLKLDIYLTHGKLITIYDPISKARSLDYRLQTNLLNCNFVKFREASYAVIPVVEPLTMDLEVNYYMSQWNIHISLDVGNRTSIDLTRSFIGAVSSAQIEELTRISDNLKPYEFELTEQYDKISEISNLYDLGLIEIEKKDYDSFRIYFQSAMNLYRDLYLEVTGIYTNAIAWIPNLILIFFFFSLGLSGLITDNRKYSSILFVTLFIVVFCLFFFTQPYLRLFISDPLVLVQRFTLPQISLILVQTLLLLFFVVLLSFSRVKSFLWQTFEVSIRNLRRRKLKTVLALFTVLIVSASAMAFLTITTEKHTVQMPYIWTKPVVDSGLVIYKIMTLTTKSSDPSEVPATITRYVPIQQHEVKWFLKHEWIQSMNVYGIRKVRFARADGFLVEGFNTFSLIVLNATFMTQYQNVSNALGVVWFADADKNSIIVGSKIAEAYRLEKGSEVLIDDTIYVVKSIVDQETTVERLRDIDGDLFLFMVFDPATRKIDEGSFIFGKLNDFEENSYSAYRVSIFLKAGYTENAIQIARDIQDFGYDFGETEDYSYTVTYSVRAISSNSVHIVYTSSPTIDISGQWQIQIVPIIMATLLLAANTMGTVSERKLEARTIYVIGASPLRVALIFMTEGLVLGIVGGILGYVFGYLLVQSADIALPTLVKKNVIGGAPFTVAISTATLASLIGCLLPSRKAVRIAVPSGRLRQRTKDIVKIKEGRAHLEVPLKVEKAERDLFGRFLENLAQEYSFSSHKIVGVSLPHAEPTEEGTLYEIAVNYMSDELASFLVLILARPGATIKVAIQPVEDVKTKKICRWNREHKNNIKKLSPILREEILRFTEFRRRELD